MNITVFQSDKGDCLLVTSRDGKRRILADGGLGPSYAEFVAPALGRLREDGKALDLVYVSHIDADHIAGVLKLLEDEVDWRVHEYQIKQNNSKHKPPKAPRPPEVRNIWHNAFSEMPADLEKKIGRVLVANAAILSGSPDPLLREISAAQRELVASVNQALDVTRRVREDQLGIPHNLQFGKKFAFLGKGQPAICIAEFDPLVLYVLGPFEEDLEKLREDWKTWHEETEKKLKAAQSQTQRKAEKLGTSDPIQLLHLREEQSKELGDRGKVTQPNLASLMLLAEEGRKTLLLTGDGHADDLLKGLERHPGKLDGQGRIHVNVLKVQHHGAEFNINEKFVSRVTADDYIFCGNGEHKNPDLRVLKMLIDSRLEEVDYKATHPKAFRNGKPKPFCLWFNSSVSATQKQEAKEHMEEIVKLVNDRADASQGLMTCRFLEAGEASFELNI